jgi:hypothetical protein
LKRALNIFAPQLHLPMKIFQHHKFL